MYDRFRKAKTKKGKVAAFMCCTFKLQCFIAFWVIAGLFIMIFGTLFGDTDTKEEPKQKTKVVTRYVPIYKHDDRW